MCVQKRVNMGPTFSTICQFLGWYSKTAGYETILFLFSGKKEERNLSGHYLSSNLSGALRNCTTGCKLQITYIDKQVSYICKKSQYDFRPKLVVLSGIEKNINILE